MMRPYTTSIQQQGAVPRVFNPILLNEPGLVEEAKASNNPPLVRAEGAVQATIFPMRNTGVLLISVFLFATFGYAQPPEIYPLSKVKRGQKGYGYTTPAGDTPKRFTFEVIGVKKNFLPTMDIILLKSDDPMFKVRGFWRGMSGSPLYIDGKLACAFSYGWSFTKTPIGGCTPLQYMIDQGLKTPIRNQAQGVQLTSQRGGNLRAALKGDWSTWKAMVPTTVAQALLPTGKFIEPNSPSLFRSSSNTNLVPSAIPLAISGIGPQTLALSKQLLGSLGIEPVSGMGGGSNHPGPDKLVMGGSIAVTFIRGAMSASGTGTVSYIDGDRILAFGHPMWQQGQLHAPVSTAHVHTVIPSMASPFVIADPAKEVGSLMLDQQSTIMADLRYRAPMIPVSISLERETNGKKSLHQFNVEVLNNRSLTGRLIVMALANAAETFLPDREELSLKIHSKLKIKGEKEFAFYDEFYTRGGIMQAVFDIRSIRALSLLAGNPFQPIEIENVEIRIETSFSTNAANIEDIRFGTPELLPGKKNYVDVIMKNYKDETIQKRVYFHVPRSLENSIVMVHVSSSDLVPNDTAVPQNFKSLTKAIRKTLPGGKLSVALFPADAGVSLNGTTVSDLPNSVRDRLATTTAKPHTVNYRPRSVKTVSTSILPIGLEQRPIKVAALKE